jgi:hypothetical protein
MLVAPHSTQHRVPSTAPTNPKNAVAAHALATRARFAVSYDAPAHCNGAPDMLTGAARSGQRAHERPHGALCRPHHAHRLQLGDLSSPSVRRAPDGVGADGRFCAAGDCCSLLWNPEARTLVGLHGGRLPRASLAGSLYERDRPGGIPSVLTATAALCMRGRIRAFFTMRPTGGHLSRKGLGMPRTTRPSVPQIHVEARKLGSAGLGPLSDTKSALLPSNTAGALGTRRSGRYADVPLYKMYVRSRISPQRSAFAGVVCRPRLLQIRGMPRPSNRCTRRTHTLTVIEQVRTAPTRPPALKDPGKAHLATAFTRSRDTPAVPRRRLSIPPHLPVTRCGQADDVSASPETSAPWEASPLHTAAG